MINRRSPIVNNPQSKIRMSYFLRVYCQSPQLVPSKEITDFIRDGWYFDEPPNF
ncbi:MAG TPA: hypothetical protein V6C90_19760 [Coleofasciculaceae cyanobacterium]